MVTLEHIAGPDNKKVHFDVKKTHHVKVYSFVLFFSVIRSSVTPPLTLLEVNDYTYCGVILAHTNFSETNEANICISHFKSLV